MIKQFLFAVSAVFLFSCSASHKAQQPAAAVATLPTLPESNINIPVKVVMKPVLAKAAVLIPREITSDGWPQYLQTSCDFHYKYRFIPGAFTFNCINNQVLVKLSGVYQVSGERCVCAFGKQSTPWIGGACGFGNEPMRKTEILIGSALSFQPNYTVRTSTVAQKVNPLEKCIVSVFSMDITQQVMDSIKSATNAFCHAMDSVVGGFDFSGTTKSLAERINRKVALGSYGYIKINPSAVRMGKMNYYHDTLQAVLGISCFPELHSDSTNSYTASFLPPLQSAERPAGITMYTNARYGYDFINHLLNQYTKDTSFVVEGHNVTLKSVQVSGEENGKLELRVDFAGDKRGILYLTGTPRLDTATQTIALPDLDYSLKSRDLVLKMGKTFFSGKILHALQAKSTIRINELVDHGRPAINAQLNKKIIEGVYSAGMLTDLKVLAIVVGKDLLQVQTCMRASAAVIITKM